MMVKKFYGLFIFINKYNSFIKNNLKRLFTRRNKEVVLCLVQIDIHTYISDIYIYIYCKEKLVIDCIEIYEKI